MSSVNIATLLCDCVHVAGTLLFQCWHYFVLVQALFCFGAGTRLFQLWHSFVSVPALFQFSAGSQALMGLPGSVSMPALTVLLRSVSVLALWHVNVFKGGLQCWHSGT